MGADTPGVASTRPRGERSAPATGPRPRSCRKSRGGRRAFLPGCHNGSCAHAGGAGSTETPRPMTTTSIHHRAAGWRSPSQSFGVHTAQRPRGQYAASRCFPMVFSWMLDAPSYIVP